MTRMVASPEGLQEAIARYNPNVRVGDIKAFQWVYFLDDLAQAQRVVQVLNALGLQARAYANQDGTNDAKIYFQFNERTPLDEKLALAPSYFALLREFSESLERNMGTLECKRTLHIASPDGINIVFSIKIEPVVRRATVEKPVEPSVSAASTASYSTPGAVNAPKKPDASSVFQKKNTPKDTDAKKLTKVGDALGSRMATHTGGIVKIIGLFFAVLIVFVMSRGFLCPDFAKARTGPIPWYCSK